MKNNFYFNKMSKTQNQTPPNSRDDQQSVLALSKASQLTFSKNEESTNSTLMLDGLSREHKIPKLFQSIDLNGRQHNKKQSMFLKNRSQKAFSIKSTQSISKQKDKFKTFKGNGKIKKIMIDLRQSENNPINSTKQSISLINSKMKSSKDNSLNSSTQIFNLKSMSAQSINIKVYARMRPSKLEDTLFRNNFEVLIDKKYVNLENSIFNFDQVFDDKSNQKQIFDRVAEPIIQDILQGYNGTIFAYGQTGSGKTHTMFGNNQKQQLKGLIPRTVQYIFQQISKKEQKYQISASMLEIYKQNMLDLFSLQKNQLKIKQSNEGIYVEGLANIKINNYKSLIELIQFGQQIRKVSSTKMNKSSSRSHTIIIINVQSHYNQIIKKGKLYLVDLAGSQKVSKSGASGQNLEQAKKINLSLSCLGNVINALTSKIPKSHIPYRDSKLTRLLQDSLSGNFKTSIIVNFSTQPSSYQQTLSTMKFAERAKKIKNSVKINTDIKNQSIQNLYIIINKLTNELQSTKNQLKKYKQNQNQNNNQQDDIPSSRLIIPSERANVSEHLKNYKSKSIKPLRINLNLDQLSSLNSFQDSSIIGSRLQLNQSYATSKEVSLNFSIKNDENSLLQSYIQKSSNIFNKVK